MVTWLHPYILGLDCVLAPVIGLGVAIKGAIFWYLREPTGTRL